MTKFNPPVTLMRKVKGEMHCIRSRDLVNLDVPLTSELTIHSRNSLIQNKIGQKTWDNLLKIRQTKEYKILLIKSSFISRDDLLWMYSIILDLTNLGIPRSNLADFIGKPPNYFSKLTPNTIVNFKFNTFYFMYKHIKTYLVVKGIIFDLDETMPTHFKTLLTEYLELVNVRSDNNG